MVDGQEMKMFILLQDHRGVSQRVELVKAIITTLVTVGVLA